MDTIPSDRDALRGAGVAAGAGAVALRPATAADRPFLLRLYAGTREQELAQTPFTPAQRTAFLHQQFTAQSAHYEREYPDASFDVVEVGGAAAGRLIVARRARELTVVDISLLAAVRGRGIGTGLLTTVIADGDARGVPVTLHVERRNPARRLYERLGFTVVADEGIHLRCARPPGARPRPQAATQAKTAS